MPFFKHNAETMAELVRRHPLDFVALPSNSGSPWMFMFVVVVFPIAAGLSLFSGALRDYYPLGSQKKTTNKFKKKTLSAPLLNINPRFSSEHYYILLKYEIIIFWFWFFATKCGRRHWFHKTSKTGGPFEPSSASRVINKISHVLDSVRVCQSCRQLLEWLWKTLP